jgi:hypothetical protein
MAGARANIRAEISADTTKFQGAMRRAQTVARATGANIGRGMMAATRSIRRLGAAAIRTSAAIAAIGGAIAIGAFSSGIKGAADLGGALSDVAAQTGIAAGKMAVLQKAFKDNGLSAEQAAPSINKMQRFIRDLGAESPAAVKAFDAMGLSFEEIRDLSPDKQLELIGKRIMEIRDPSIRAATAMDIFGRSGGRLITLFGDAGAMANAEGFLGTAAEILNRRAGDFDKISDRLASIPAKLQGFFVGFLDGVAEPISEILTKFESIDFAEIGQRFAAGLNMDNIQAALSATFTFATIALSEGLIKAFEMAYAFFNALFSAEGLAFLGVSLKGVLFATFETAGKFLSDILVLGIEKAQALWNGEPLFKSTGEDVAETASDFARRLKEELSGVEVGPSETLKAAAAQYAEMLKSIFPKVTSPKGRSSEADIYDRELEEQRKRVAADAAAMAAQNAPLDVMGPPAPSNYGATSANRARMFGEAARPSGRAFGEAGAALGGDNVFAQDRARLGIASGLSTGGLGEKRKFGAGRDDQKKKQEDYAKTQVSLLEDIDKNISAALTVA